MLLNSEKIWKIQKKSRFKSEMIWKMQKKKQVELWNDMNNMEEK